MAIFRISKTDKEWFAERCGEMLVKVFTHHISKVIDEAMLRHPGVSRREIESAYRTANPNNSQYATKRYNSYYKHGAGKTTKKSDTTENNRIFICLEIGIEVNRQQACEAISKIL